MHSKNRIKEAIERFPLSIPTSNIFFDVLLILFLGSVGGIAFAFSMVLIGAFYEFVILPFLFI